MLQQTIFSALWVTIIVLTIKQLTSSTAGETALSGNLSFPCCNNNINLSNQSMFRLGLKLKYHIAASEVKHRRFPFEHQEALFRYLAQVVQRACGVSILGVIQKLSGHAPAQTALGVPAWAGVLGQMTPDVPANLILFGILWDFSRRFQIQKR